MTTRPHSLNPPAHLAGLQLLADPAVVVGADQTVVYVNPSASRLLGLEPANVIGLPARKVVCLRTEDGMDWWDADDPLRVEGGLPGMAAEQELNLIVHTKPHPVAVTGVRFEDGPDGDGLVITLRGAKARRERDEARSDLVSTVSHELRSPLTSVKGFTRTLLAKWDRFSDDQKKQMLATINEDADRVTRLLEELLSVARLDVGRLQLKRQMVQLEPLIPRVVHHVQAGIGQGRRIDVHIDRVPALYVDPDRMEQVLVNLLENAIKYTEGDIVLTAAESGDVVTVSVSDVGPGIAPDLQRAVFGKFFRGPRQTRPGNGLGLYITKGLVEAHGGEIWITSEGGNGATFSFTLPQGGLELGGIDSLALRGTVIDPAGTTITPGTDT